MAKAKKIRAEAPRRKRVRRTIKQRTGRRSSDVNPHTTTRDSTYYPMAY